MIAVDTNILVYAHREDSPWHEKALDCVTALADSGVPWAITWSGIHEFLAIVTHPRIYDPPTPLATAIEALDGSGLLAASHDRLFVLARQLGGLGAAVTALAGELGVAATSDESGEVARNDGQEA